MKKIVSVFLICIVSCVIGISTCSAKKCIEYDKSNCENNSGASVNRTHACVWNEEYGFCNVNDLTYLQCGNSYDIPKVIPNLTSFAVTLLKVGTPIILIVVSIITLLKAVAAQKEEEIKKAQASLIKKIIAGILVFLIISIVQFVILKVGEDESGNITSCLKCFLNNDCEGDTYFKDGYGECFRVSDKSSLGDCELK